MHIMMRSSPSNIGYLPACIAYKISIKSIISCSTVSIPQGVPQNTNVQPSLHFLTVKNKLSAFLWGKCTKKIAVSLDLNEMRYRLLSSIKNTSKYP